MSPVGNFVCLDAAIKAGADAVYFGLQGSNMRAGAINFSMSDMKKLCRICDKNSVKKYLTLNTIYFDDESKSVEKILKTSKKYGVDAVIAWDFSVIELAKKIGLEVFLSTQASVSNAISISTLFKKFGIKRFVLARECTLAQMKSIRLGLNKILGKKDAGKITLEVFAHGAMCISISGRCFLSQFQCGKSANRGECLQPCRREYTIKSEKGEELLLGTNYVLSPKDLCTLPFLEKLIEAGANSLKIEGRNRNPEYVYASTYAYRKVRDFYFQNKDRENFEKEFSVLKTELTESLKNVFYRGFSEGFYMGKPIGDWSSSGNFAYEKKSILGCVTNFYSNISVAQIRVDVGSVSVGDEIQIEGNSSGFNRIKITDMRVNDKLSSKAKKGESFCIKTTIPLKRNDRVYKFIKT